MYQLSNGEHTVAYTLKDPTEIGGDWFGDCSILSVTIPNNITTIEGYAFFGCNILSGSIIIPDSVTTIGSEAFAYCNLNSITCLSTTAPTIVSSTFRDVGSNGTLTVPSGSSGYDVWMGTRDYYLGKYGWEMVEQ